MIRNHGRKILIGILLLAAFLRLWRLDEVPVSLFGDELDVGYQAYSILETGKDYSGNPWPLHFRSFAEWRTPLYLYSSVPTVAAFGISPWGVRLPAAIFGILGIWLFYLLTKKFTDKEGLALLAAFLLAISPWHIQYSRAGFEATQMLALYLAGLYFFLRAIKESGKFLSLSAIFLGLTPWVYSTAKFFLPITAVILFLVWWGDLKKISKKYLVWALAAFFVVVFPIAWSTVFGGGTARFQYISIFTDPTTIPEVGFDRLQDARVRDPQAQFGIQPSVIDRAFHNKIISWSGIFFRNYLQPFSTHFLFIEGDLNIRHSPESMGQLYRFEVIFLILGIIFFSVAKFDKKAKLFILLWALAAPIPAALTRDGGMHATRLFFFLPVLIFLVAVGIYYSFQVLKRGYRGLFIGVYLTLLFLSFIFYQHNYWVHYPWDSERWWHAGFKRSVDSVKELESQYDKIIFSTASEPPWIFFAALYPYPPKEWQEKSQSFDKETIRGFGEISYIGKFYFGTADLPSGIYSLPELLNERMLYIASAKEFRANFIQEPERLPKNIKLIKAVTYPSGEPVFYLFTAASGNEK